MMSSSTLLDAELAAPALASAESRELRSLGFWIYLMSDAIVFSLLFATYATMSRNYAGGATGKELFDLSHTLGETALLLASSLTCGFALLATQRRRTTSAVSWLIFTLLFGLGFVGMEVTEFQGMIQQGAGPDCSGFLSAFFTLVGTHGMHVSLGMVWLLVMVVQLVAIGPTMVQSRLQRWSAFWHFLDIVWIGIFSVVYLPGVL